MCVASVECAYGQEEVCAASCRDLLSYGHGGEGLDTSLPGWPACLSLHCCAQNLSELLRGEINHLKTVLMALKRHLLIKLLV